jgi:long-chain fatty acid transport protein
MGMAVIGGGAGTRYGQAVDPVPGSPQSSSFFNFNGRAGRDELGVLLLNMQMLPSIAYEFLRHKKYGRHTIGASLAIGISAFRARGLGAFGQDGIKFSGATDKLTDNGVDFAFGSGVRVGWLGRFNKKKLNVGINYATKVYMTPFEKYTGLFAEQGTFDIPEHYAIGVAVKANKKITVAMDIQRINYSNVASIANSGPISDGEGGFFERCPEKDTDVTKCFTGEGSGLGFGWTDQTIYKLGVAYEHNKKWSFRGGLNYGKSPIPDDQILFNMLAPATVEKHLTFGFSYRPNKQNEFSFNYMRAFNNEQTGRTVFPPIAPEGSTFDNAAISMNQHSIGATWGINI